MEAVEAIVPKYKYHLGKMEAKEFRLLSLRRLGSSRKRGVLGEGEHKATSGLWRRGESGKSKWGLSKGVRVFVLSCPQLPLFRIPIRPPTPTSDDFPSDSGNQGNLVSLSEGVKVLKIAVRAIFAPSRFSLARISIQDLVAGRKPCSGILGLGVGVRSDPDLFFLQKVPNGPTCAQLKTIVHRLQRVARSSTV